MLQVAMTSDLCQAIGDMVSIDALGGVATNRHCFHSLHPLFAIKVLGEWVGQLVTTPTGDMVYTLTMTWVAVARLQR